MSNRTQIHVAYLSSRGAPATKQSPPYTFTTKSLAQNLKMSNRTQIHVAYLSLRGAPATKQSPPPTPKIFFQNAIQTHFENGIIIRWIISYTENTARQTISYAIAESGARVIPKAPGNLTLSGPFLRQIPRVAYKFATKPLAQNLKMRIRTQMRRSIKKSKTQSRPILHSA